MTAIANSREPLRIVHSESSCGWGGQEIRILVEAAGMIARGHDVQLVCPPEATIFQAARDRKIPVTPLPIVRRNGHGFSAVRAWLKKHPVDVVNTHSSTDSWLFSLAARTRRHRPGIVRTRHISSHVSRDPFTKWLYGRGADRLVTTGERLRQTFVDYNRLRPEHVISVPTGIDLAHFQPRDRNASRAQLGLPKDRLLVGIVATIRSWKGHIYLIDALAQLPQKDEVLVVVVGDGPSRQLVEKRIADRGVANHVRLVGQQEDVAPWLQSLDIFALPSFANEGVPQSIMQAMSCGLPVVSTPVGSIDEAVTHEETGLLVPPKDAAALAQALWRLARDPELRRKMGRQGRLVAESKFTFAAMIDRMETIFYQVARRDGRRMSQSERTRRAA